MAKNIKSTANGCGNKNVSGAKPKGGKRPCNDGPRASVKLDTEQAAIHRGECVLKLRLPAQPHGGADACAIAIETKTQAGNQRCVLEFWVPVAVVSVEMLRAAPRDNSLFSP